MDTHHVEDGQGKLHVVDGDHQHAAVDASCHEEVGALQRDVVDNLEHVGQLLGTAEDEDTAQVVVVDKDLAVACKAVVDCK